MYDFVISPNQISCYIFIIRARARAEPNLANPIWNPVGAVNTYNMGKLEIRPTDMSAFYWKKIATELELELKIELEIET